MGPNGWGRPRSDFQCHLFIEASLKPLSLDLVLVGGALKLWVPLFPPHAPFRVMALCHFSATQQWFWSSTPQWIEQETLEDVYLLRASLQRFFTELLLPQATPGYKAQTLCSWIPLLSLVFSPSLGLLLARVKKGVQGWFLPNLSMSTLSCILLQCCTSGF